MLDYFAASRLSPARCWALLHRLRLLAAAATMMDDDASWLGALDSIRCSGKPSSSPSAYIASQKRKRRPKPTAASSRADVEADEEELARVTARRRRDDVRSPAPRAAAWRPSSPAASSSSASPARGGGRGEALGECPVCSTRHPLSLLQRHVDECLARPPASSSSASARSEAPPPLLRLAPASLAASSAAASASPVAAAASSSSPPLLYRCVLCDVRFASLDTVTSHEDECLQRTWREAEHATSCSGVSGSNLASHQQRCTAEHKKCEHCLQYRLASQLPDHAATCARQQREIDEGGMAVMAMQRDELSSQLLTVEQSLSVRHVVDLAKKKSIEAEPKLLERLLLMGFGEQHLRSVKRFIRHDAPLNIHVAMDRAGPKLLVDTHYRNCHEVAGHINRGRCGVESKLFGGHYPGTPKFDRVKYGCVNYSLDPNGVSSAHGYGDSYLLLRNETVRARITITSVDSCSPAYEIGTCDWFCHILLTYTDPELKSLVQVVTGERRHTSNSGSMYKEVQIHGPVRLAEDVAALCFNARHSTDRETLSLIEQFRVRTKVEAITLEAQAHPVPSLF